MDILSQLTAVLEKLRDDTRDRQTAADLKVALDLVSAATRETDVLQKDRLKGMAELSEARSKISVLEQRLKKLQTVQVKEPPPREEFIEHQGVLFKLRAGGSFDETPHCLKCRRPMKIISESIPFTCPSCKTMASFLPAEVTPIVFKLANK